MNIKVNKQYVMIVLFMALISHVFAQKKLVYVAAEKEAVAQLAASELVKYLNQMYPADEFVQVNKSGKSPTFRLELNKNNKSLNGKAEAFCIYKRKNQVVIEAAKPRGLLYGVFEFLENRGCYFQLSDEFVPVYKNTSFTIPEINICDVPLTQKRIVFNWHNFLSGCSGWELADWQKYIRQASKLRYNTIMIHAYGNNPMIKFTYNGLEKTIGYMSSTNKGRDWGTQHANDVRNIIGAESLYTDKVFAPEAAKVTDDQRYTTAKELMQQVFDYAHQWGMKIILAYDVDSEPANPQNILKTLPEHALIKIEKGKYVVANPDTKEGYEYYKAQLKQILDDYPQIDEYALWNRAHTGKYGIIWGLIRKDDMPETWQKEFEQAFPDEKENTAFNHVVFAWSKMLDTYQRLLKDLGKEHIKLSTGSWSFDFMGPLHRVADKSIPFIPLDFRIEFGKEEIREQISTVSQQRRVIPILWSHHDDFSYVGRPYRPFENLADVFEKMEIKDFAIIHWLTRPQDYYFKNTMQQLWQQSKNKKLESTLSDYSNAVINTSDSVLFAKFLTNWMKDAPMFGRETSNNLIDRKLLEVEKVIADCSQRIDQLQKIDKSHLNAYAGDLVSFHLNYDKFIRSFYEAHSDFEKANAAIKDKDIATATRLADGINPEKVINHFSDAIRSTETSAGGKGMLYSLNTRWLPQMTALKQSLGLKEITYIFGETKHDFLAKDPGKHTFYFDKNGHLSQCLGNYETKLVEYENKQKCEDQFCGVVIESTYSFDYKPFVDFDFSKTLKGTLHLYLSTMNTSKARVKITQKSTDGASKEIVVDGKDVELEMPINVVDKFFVVDFDTDAPVVLNKMVFKQERSE
ncbi:hypothetical protein FKX85_16175 [Echinicola soli]|uniref:Glycosyl hydrolase family 20, domain 2 n=1 Tax=Echinicola soli TaxID=2591634 RepID=A0A514CKY4_9BACT|nr:hypothetical protein [Echinicola soli]QDH80495.1 hypothetical protein FKX85_16175 [Echinicola soli]